MNATRDVSEAYPAELEAWTTLPGGRRLHIRPLRNGEAETVRDLYAHLSDRTRYQRFLFVTRELPEPILRLLIGVDYHHRLALVAQEASEDGGAIVGLGSFASVDEESAELGLVVRDDWQRQRVGTELAHRVMQAAEDRGFHRFVANMLPDNAGIRRIVKRSGDIVSATTSAGLTELVFIRRHALTLDGISRDI
jgi:RimJ/RimL family protein N-acetyltransferase